MHIQLFDTSLRDGIQNAPPGNFPSERKLVIFEHIKTIYRPHNIEVGSLCCPTVFPIMNDTMDIYNHAIREHENYPKYNKSNVYVLVPSISKFKKALAQGITSMSFITSVSNVFQLQNTGVSIRDVKRSFTDIFNILRGEPDYQNYRKKLYISCISECPISGAIPLSVISDEIRFYYLNYDFDELCLSDTCGTLSYEDFVEIVEKSHVPKCKLSLHLHMSPTNYDNIENILLYCFRSGIHKFDVSLLTTGGCTQTVSSDKLSPNLTYDTFYKIYQKFSETTFVHPSVYIPDNISL